MNILITGGCGFVGSNLAVALKNDGHDIIVFDNLKRRGSELNLSRFKDVNIEFVHGDIRNEEDFESIPMVDMIIDASAEPSVMAGLNGGHKQLVNINLIGTINILNLALKHKAGFIFLSTSRIYPIQLLNNIVVSESDSRFIIEDEQVMHGISKNGITEEFPLNGYRSLYGTSKLASELLIHEYVHFYGLKAVINRFGVIAGPYQMGKIDQGVTVLWVARHFWKKDLAYFGYGGTGKQVRDVLHIEDFIDLIKLQLNDLNKFENQIFNIGGGFDSSYSLRELTGICEIVTGNKLNIKTVDEDRAADIRLYITDNQKIYETCGWRPKRNAENVVIDIYNWISNNFKDLEKILN